MNKYERNDYSMYSIIINPNSGKGNYKQILSSVEKLLHERGIQYRIERTVKPGDAVIYTKKAIEDGMSGIIAMGGDGTFSEVANGAGESGIEIIFAPCGTGNDFMRMFPLPSDTVEAVKLQLDSPVRMLDLGKCNDRYFLNVTGCGFDVDVLIAADKYKGKSSQLGAYLRGAYSAIKAYKPMRSLVSVDGSKPTEMLTTIISVGNGSYIGGGMKALPGAAVDDGYFNVIIVKKIWRPAIYALLLLFAAGKHTLIKKLVKSFKCRQIRIQSSGMNLEADGEIFSCNDVTMKIIPAALRTRLPR